MSWVVFKFFWGYFLNGFLAGIVIRIFIYSFFRNKTTIKGLVNTGILAGIIFMIWALIGLYT